MNRYNNFSDILLNARKISGLTQVQVAQALGSSQSNLSKIERGIYEPSAIEYALFCNLTGLSLTTINKMYIDYLDLSHHSKFLKKIPKSTDAALSARLLSPLTSKLNLDIPKGQFAHNRLKVLPGLSVPETFASEIIQKGIDIGLIDQISQECSLSAEVHSEAFKIFPKKAKPKDIIKKYLSKKSHYENIYESKILAEEGDMIEVSLTALSKAPKSMMLYYGNFLQGLVKHANGFNFFQLNKLEGQSWKFTVA